VAMKKLPSCFRPGAPEGYPKGRYLWVDYEIGV